MDDYTPACIRVVTRDVRQEGYMALGISIDPCPMIAWCEAHASKRWKECPLRPQGGYTAVPEQSGDVRTN